MKSLIILIALITILGSATATQASVFAGKVPHCWDTDGILYGSYIIGINTDTASKEDILEIMDRASGIHIRPQGYPVVFSSSMYITVQAQEETRMEAEEELIAISEFGSVNIRCNALYYPTHGVVKVIY